MKLRKVRILLAKPVKSQYMYLHRQKLSINDVKFHAFNVNVYINMAFKQEVFWSHINPMVSKTKDKNIFHTSDVR
jgi:hypothetical protein